MLDLQILQWRLNVEDGNSDCVYTDLLKTVNKKSSTGLNGLSCESDPAPSLTPHQRRQTSQWEWI